jgi:TonB family protein
MGLLKIVRSLPLAAVAALSAHAQAAGDQPLTLAPTSQWNVDYTDDSCALRRAFGTGDATATLQLRMFSPGDQYELMIVSDALGRARGAPRVRYGSDEEWFEPVAPLVMNSRDQHGVVFSDTLRPVSLKARSEAEAPWTDAERDAREAAVTTITLAGSFEHQLTLQTGAMHPPMEAMRTCIDELVTHWGLDSAAQDTLTRKVQPVEQRDWQRQILGEYPTDMLRQGKSGRVPVRVIVDTAGKPTNCIAVEHSADPAFENAACAGILRHARFEPALDAQGRPVTSYWVTTVIYETERRR